MLLRCVLLKRSRLLVVLLAFLCFLYLLINDTTVGSYRKRLLQTKTGYKQPADSLHFHSSAQQQSDSFQVYLSATQPSDALEQTRAFNLTGLLFGKKSERESDFEEESGASGELEGSQGEEVAHGDDIRPRNRPKSPKHKNAEAVAQDRKERTRAKKSLTLLSQEEYDRIKDIHDQRRGHIQEVCKRFVIPSHSEYMHDMRLLDGQFYKSLGKTVLPQAIRGDSFQADKTHRVLYCSIYKAGSTSWNAMFARLLNRTEFDEKKNYFEIRKIMTPKRSRDLLESMTYYTFMMVRHPFTRLLSAYRDRIEDMSHASWQRETFGPIMLRFSRRGLRDMKNKDGKMKFAPTFAEFVNYLLLTPQSRYDPHWMPYYRHCSPCVVNYSAIAKLETRNEDIPFILEDAGLAGKVEMQVLNENSNKGRGSTTKLLKEYYSTISLKQLKDLYRIYEIDFHLFGYDVRTVLDLVYPNATIKPALV
ncbi:carbohydrate sulfotransferase 11-like [Oratosquilla oratoria]|uniref:carbohydrate sulfotransferase 11-like n=1 Tax=Oratosquilla oratoria TaxID=337810 RepID=UPI003F77515B